MTLEEAITKSIKRYFEGIEPEELSITSTKKRKYTKKYFDNIAKRFELGSDDEDDD